MHGIQKENAEELIKIEDDYSAETDADALRFSDHDQYAGYADSSSSESDEFEVSIYSSKHKVSIAPLQFELTQRQSYSPQRSSPDYDSHHLTSAEQPCSSLQVR